MASSFTNDLRLEEIASGEQSGTWGDTTNTNLELIAEALSYGTQDCFSSDANATTTVADGAADPARSLYFKATSSATLSTTRVLTIAPNTISRVMIIENATTGSQIITIKQGTGNTINIANGVVKVVYLDGAGAGAAVQDALVDLDLTGTTNLDIVDIDGAVNMASTLTSGTDVGINSEYAVLGDDTSSRELKFSQYQTGGANNNAGHKINASSGYGELALAVGGTNALTLNASQKATFAGEVAAASLSIGGTTVSSTAAELNVLDPALKENNSIWIGSDPSGTTSTASNNVALGVNALDAITTADSVTALGYGALGALTTGSSNTAVGVEAMLTTTSGNNNVALGLRALSTNTIGDRSTAIGYQALNTSDPASNADMYNVAVGYNAGYDLTTGVRNTLIGALAGDEVSTGDANTAVGYLAGGGSTSGAATGDNNTSVGADALGAVTTGHSNTAVGKNAMLSSTEATYATALGFAALQSTTAGSGNVAVGGFSMQSNTTGDRNVAVGYLTLDANQQGDRNTAVGYEALTTMNPSGNVDTYNSAFGHRSLASMTTGTANTGLGFGTLENTTTAGNNTAVGGAALQLNDGDRNTACGYSSLQQNDDGNDSVAVGYYALTSLTTGGTQNTAVGAYAGEEITTGDRNVSIGYHTGGAVGAATGDQNTSVGTLAGEELTSGSLNVLVGYNVGSNSVNLTAGHQNVLIGSHCDTTAVDSDNATGIGYNLDCEAGYTTIGNAGSDIRAAHGNIVWAVVSDERYKKDIVDSSAGLDFINALRPRTFKYKTLGELPETFRPYEAGSTEVFKNSNTNHGFIAQEVKAAIDADDSVKDGFRLWDDREDGSQEVAEAALIPILVKAIQEQQVLIESLTTRIAALES